MCREGGGGGQTGRFTNLTRSYESSEIIYEYIYEFLEDNREKQM